MEKQDFWMLFQETGIPEYYLAFRMSEEDTSRLR